jgi:alpha-mannosidase
VTIDYKPSGNGTGPGPDDGERSAALGWAVERALTRSGIGPEPGSSVLAGTPHDRGGEIAVDLLDRVISAGPGDTATLRVSLSSSAASQIRGEAQVLSPFETWTTIRPWTQGFTVEPGDRTTIEFAVAPPRDVVPGTYWALVKVMYFGRMLYSESVPVTIPAASEVRTGHLVAGPT